VSALLRTANGAWAHRDDPGEPGWGDKPRWSVTPREAGILGALARGRVVLEIGTGLGISTAALAAAAERVLTVDIDPWVAVTVAPGLPANVAFYADRAALPADARWSLAFIDGYHHCAAVSEDIRFARARLERPGLIVLHDGRMPHVQFGMEQAKVDLGTAFPMATEAGLILISVSGAR